MTYTKYKVGVSKCVRTKALFSWPDWPREKLYDRGDKRGIIYRHKTLWEKSVDDTKTHERPYKGFQVLGHATRASGWRMPPGRKSYEVQEGSDS
jgi:hypothetical protein